MELQHLAEVSRNEAIVFGHRLNARIGPRQGLRARGRRRDPPGPRLTPAAEADRRPIDKSSLMTPSPSSASGSSANLIRASHKGAWCRAQTTSGRRQCANSGHSPTGWRTGPIDPSLPFLIGPGTEGMRRVLPFKMRLPSGRSPPFATVCVGSDERVLWADLCRSRAMLEGRCPAQSCPPRGPKVTAGSRGSCRESL